MYNNKGENGIIKSWLLITKKINKYMKKLNKNSMVVVIVLVFSLAFGFTLPITLHAATAPSLGAAETYSVYGDAGVTNDLSATTHVWGNVGHNGFGATNLDDATQVDGAIR